MIDLSTEIPLRLPEAARRVGAGRANRPTHSSTILRWILTGVTGPGGRKVRLDGLRVGSHWVTSVEALQRFAESLTPDLDAPQQPAPRSPSSRQRASERAARQLEKFGI